MNTDVKPGDKVRFTRPHAGYQSDQRLTAAKFTVGSKYTVERMLTHSFYTDVFLKEVPGVKFNSVQFEDAV